ncbi:MAG: adenylosuccinate lyase [Rhodospirillaceae bacterium]|nr:adenylosuccinate lyase [Rhodospirillaceae bacterium]
MSAYVMDSELFRDQFSTPETRRIFSDRTTVQKWLDFELALAQAEAELGMIPKSAAEEIARICDAELYDLAAMKAEMDRTSHPIVPLVRAMEEKCAKGNDAKGGSGIDAGGYIHWGATTQDVMDTGQILQIKEAWAAIAADLEILTENLISLAREHRTTPMAGRTHGQQAQPITFGYKVAIWLDEVRRHQARMSAAADRVFVGQFSGAVGSLAAIEENGLAVQTRMIDILGLKQPNICWHVARDTMAEAASVMAMLAGTMGKIAHEVYVMQKTEVAELEEPMPPGKVGSSTMPHKRNPAICEGIVALAKATKACLVPAFENIVADHERDKIGLQAEREYVARLHGMTHAAVKKVSFVTGGLNVRADNMRRNLDITGGLLLSEAVMMKLAPIIGRQEAHEIVYQPTQQAAIDGQSMRDALMASPEITSKLSEAEIDQLLDPAAYTGLCAAFVDRVLGD